MGREPAVPLSDRLCELGGILLQSDGGLFEVQGALGITASPTTASRDAQVLSLSVTEPSYVAERRRGQGIVSFSSAHVTAFRGLTTGPQASGG